MKAMKEFAGLFGISAVLLLLCVAGIVWDVASGLLFNGIDGIMLLLVCLMMAGIFSLEILITAKSAGLIGSLNLLSRRSKGTGKTVAEPAEKVPAGAPGSGPKAAPAAVAQAGVEQSK